MQPAAREKGSIVVCDDVVDVALVGAELGERWAGRVRVDLEAPSGPGVVALLAGPGSSVTREVLVGLPDLRVVVVTSMGWDHVDVAAARSRGIVVTGVEPYCVDEVAEHTVALVLDLLRGVTWLDASVRGGAWDYARVGRPVRGAELGLVGLGRVGAAVAWRARALGLVVSAFDPFVPTAPVSAQDGDGAVRMVHSLDALVAGSDIVSVHVPLTDATKGLVDAHLLGRFRPGSYLVNVSRGEVVTEEALGEALRSGALAGAALDVLGHEPPSEGDAVLGFPRTVITPHAAWYSPAAIERLSRSAGRETARVLAEIETVGRTAS